MTKKVSFVKLVFSPGKVIAQGRGRSPRRQTFVLRSAEARYPVRDLAARRAAINQVVDELLFSLAVAS